MKKTIKDWIIAIRPWSLTASAMPALLAISFVFCNRHTFDAPVSWGYGVLALLGAVIFQTSGNLLNDYFDYIYKVDRDNSYSSRSLVDGIFTPRTIYIYGLLMGVVGSAIGLFLLYSTGLHLLWIGILGILGAYFYNRMKYIALGDFVIFIIYGLLIALGVAYVMTGVLLWNIFWISSSSGLLIVGILHANNTRDMRNDGVANIKTQAMAMGVELSKKYFVCLMIGAYFVLLFAVLFRVVHPISFAASLFTLPITLKLIKQMNAVHIDTLDTIKTLTESVAQLVLLFSVLLAFANFVVGYFNLTM
ncbi:prenyltransferase [Bacteroides sp. OttesenSCG-928-J23]|nr:prenyltransferase [Bacteroides sp. OttesenSCG-928-J23]